ncbi:MAG TPA: J domain-containing protein [Pirellulales bacterium]|jgi:curved DNA-binding protein CbpA|nr:J domain-containing protein [Pirellulales bacterium]
MNDPFEELGLAHDADDATIRARYLQLVREFPPDRAPERFAAVRAAYDELRDPVSRLEKQIFYLSSGDSLAALTSDLRQCLRTARLPLDAMLALAETP